MPGNPQMHPGLSIRVDGGRAWLVVLTDDAVTELEVTQQQLSALAGEAVRKSMILALGG